MAVTTCAAEDSSVTSLVANWHVDAELVTWELTCSPTGRGRNDGIFPGTQTLMAPSHKEHTHYIDSPSGLKTRLRPSTIFDTSLRTSCPHRQNNAELSDAMTINE